MVVLEFMDCMEAELNRIFEGMVFKNSLGKETGVHVFKQDFPIRRFQAGEEEETQEDDFFPYCVIRAENGTNGNFQSTDITLTFGICERDENNSGEIRILNLIERVSQYFLNNRVIGGKFRLNYDSPIRWGLPTKEEDTYPYFYGLMEMTWDSFYEVKEDDYV